MFRRRHLVAFLAPSLERYSVPYINVAGGIDVNIGSEHVNPDIDFEAVDTGHLDVAVVDEEVLTEVVAWSKQIWLHSDVHTSQLE